MARASFRIHGLAAALGGTLLIVTMGSGAAAPAAWQYREFHNPVVGAATHLAEVQTAEVTVSVRCVAGYPYPEVRIYLGDEVLGDFEQIAWKFDAAPYRPAGWSRSPNGQSLIVPGTETNDFLTMLRRFNQLSLQVTSPGSESEFAVPLAGSGAAIDTVIDNCR